MRRERLKRRIEHWIEHNREHAEGFRRAAEEAEALRLHEVSEVLRGAAKRLEEASSLLEKASSALEAKHGD